MREKTKLSDLKLQQLQFSEYLYDKIMNCDSKVLR